MARWLAVLVCMAPALAGCAASRRCLSGPAPVVGRPVPDEIYALMRREYARAERADTVVAAHVLEKLPRLFPDVSDLIDEPRCSTEWVERMAAIFDQRELGFSRSMLAQIRSVGAIGDTTDVMEAKAAFLIRLADLDEAHIPAYRFLPDEVGPAPPKSTLQHLALAELAGSNLYLNVAAARAFLVRRSARPRDDREALLLSYTGREVIEQPLWGPAAKPSAAWTDADHLLRGWIDDASRRLAGPAGAAALEIVIGRLPILATYAGRFGAEAAARALVAAVLDARGEVPLTRGISGGARDLALAAWSALATLDRHPAHVEAEGVQPVPRRQVIHAWEGLFAERRERVQVAAARERMRVLDGELGRLRHAAPRCYVIGEQGVWVPDRDAAALFEALTAPIFDDRGRIALRTEMLCRAEVALALDPVAPAPRIALAVRLLRAAGADILEFDTSADEHHPALVILTDKDQVRAVSARAIAAHPEWIDSSPELRAALHAAAADELQQLRARDDSSEMMLTTIVDDPLRAALGALLAHDAEHGAVEDARRLLVAWSDAIAELADPAPAGAPESAAAAHRQVLPVPWTAARLWLVAEYAQRFEVADRTRALLDQLRQHDEAHLWDGPVVLARYLLDSPGPGPRGASAP